MMSRDALPCIACGWKLENVDEGADNQPYGGTAFRSYGHYGSTIFDPMDGRFLEVNICDGCLRSKAAKHVLMGQDRKLVTMPGPFEGMPSVIGTTPIHRELVPWDPDVESETEAHHLQSYEDLVETRELGFKVDTRFTEGELQEMFKTREDT